MKNGIDDPLFASSTKSTLFGEGNSETNEYLTRSFRALRPNQPTDLGHGMLPKMPSAV